MDLARYLATESTLLVILPRFTSADPIVDIFNDYLLKKGFATGKTDSSVIHSFHDADDFTVIIFNSLIAFYQHRLKNKKSIDIIMVEWGFNQEILNEIIKSYPRAKSLKVNFLKDPRSVKFSRVGLPMSTKMADWYSAIMNSEASVVVKSMAGNHHYDASSFSDKIKSLTNPKETTQFLPETYVPGNDFQRNLMNTAGKHFFDNVYPADTEHTLFGSKSDLIKNSPKIFNIASTFIDKPGKYLIVTSHLHAYGTRLISYGLSKILGSTPHALTPDMSEAEQAEVIDIFNNSQYSILITSVVPRRVVKGVGATIIMDNYDIPYVIQLLKSVCGHGCGSYNNPMPMVFLTVEFPTSDPTLELVEAEQALEIIEQLKINYLNMEKQSRMIEIKGGDLWVV